MPVDYGDLSTLSSEQKLLLSYQGLTVLVQVRLNELVGKHTIAQELRREVANDTEFKAYQQAQKQRAVIVEPLQSPAYLVEFLFARGLLQPTYPQFACSKVVELTQFGEDFVRGCVQNIVMAH